MARVTGCDLPSAATNATTLTPNKSKATKPRWSSRALANTMSTPAARPMGPAIDINEPAETRQWEAPRGDAFSPRLAIECLKPGRKPRFLKLHHDSLCELDR